MIVGIAGLAGHGKDQSAVFLMQALANKHKRAERYAMADPLKVCVGKFMGWGNKEAYGSLKEKVLEGKTSLRKIQAALDQHINPHLKTKLAKAEDYLACLEADGVKITTERKERTVEVTIVASPRKHYQIFGTEFIRKLYCDSFWYDLAAKYARENSVDYLLIPDIRFPNEESWVKDHGVLVGVHRANFKNEVGLTHPSEKNVEYLLSRAEKTIINSGDLDYLKVKCEEVGDWLIGLQGI